MNGTRGLKIQSNVLNVKDTIGMGKMTNKATQKQNRLIKVYSEYIKKSSELIELYKQMIDALQKER